MWPELRNVCHHNVQYILAAIGWVPASVRKYKGEKEDHQAYARRVQRARDLSPVELEDLDMASKKIRNTAQQAKFAKELLRREVQDRIYYSARQSFRVICEEVRCERCGPAAL